VSLVVPVPGVRYALDSAATDWEAAGHLPGEATAVASYDWDDLANVPWAYRSEDDWLNNLPLGNNTIVPIQVNGALTFLQNANNTVNANPGNIVLDLRNAFGAPQVYHLTSFNMAGTSGIPTYAYGMFIPRLRGFIGHGPDKTIIQMDAGSTNTDQLNEMKTMAKATFSPLQMSCIRLDGITTSGNSILLGGMGFRAEDQPLLTAVAADMTGIYVPQPSPHNGLYTYGGSTVYVSHCRFQAFGRAILGQPPFECANFSSQYGNVRIWNSEFDGRRSPDVDPARPRRCNPIMPNNEYWHEMTDCYIHHSNVSRYAANDQNRVTLGTYTLTRIKADYITERENIDPAINGGNSLGGMSMATPFGWENCNGTIIINDCIVHQRNARPPDGTGQKPAHFQMTNVVVNGRTDGSFTARGTLVYNEGHPDIDGYWIQRIGNTSHWKTQGYNNTLFIYNPLTGVRLTPYEYTGTFPPTRAFLEGLGVRQDTHYLVVLA
jgi:hypothetical protein